MRNVVLYISVSLDGYIARPDGSIDWLLKDQDYGFPEFSSKVDTVLLGRKTYEHMAAQSEFPYTGKHCYVFSRNRWKQSDDRVIYATEGPVVLVRQLKRAEGKNIWLAGGSDLIKEFIAKELIDEFVLSVHPVMLGSGIPLFRPPFPTAWLTLADCTNFPSGLVQLTYTRQAR